mgnify:CR=1 FL=1
MDGLAIAARDWDIAEICSVGDGVCRAETANVVLVCEVWDPRVSRGRGHGGDDTDSVECSQALAASRWIEVGECELICLLAYARARLASKEARLRVIMARTRATHVTSAATQRSRCVRIVRDRAAGGLA